LSAFFEESFPQSEELILLDHFFFVFAFARHVDFCQALQNGDYLLFIFDQPTDLCLKCLDLSSAHFLSGIGHAVLEQIPWL